VAWSLASRRALAAGTSVIVGVAVGILTNVVTDQPTAPLVAGLVTLVVVLTALQILLTISDGSRPRRRVGAGAVRVDGSSMAAISTNVAGVRRSSLTSADVDDVAEAGSVVVDGNSIGEIRTRVRDTEER